MKPLALNISKMKKISGDKNSSVFLHPDGHKITVAHSGISALQRKQLESLPVHKMADGGDANSSPLTPDSSYYNEEDLTPDQAKENASDQNRSPASFAGDIGKSVGSALRQSVSDVSDAAHAVFSPVAHAVGDVTSGLVSGISGNDGAPPQVTEPVAAPDVPARAPADAPSQPGTQSQGVGYTPGPVNLVNSYNQGQNAITEQADIEAKKAKAAEAVQNQDLEQRQVLNQQFQDNLKQFNTHQSQFMQDYMNNHIDPKHYQNNMSTGQKIGTPIGLLLGSVGAAKTGQPNMALEMLNKNIDLDIQSQQQRLDQQKTLLGANQSLYQDNVMGLNQTRINMNDIYDHKIQQSASALGTPQAKAAADAAHAQFAMQNAALLQQNAMRATVMSHLKSGGAGLNAVDLSNAGLIPQEDAMKEQASIDGQKKAIASADAIFEKYRQEQTASNFLNPESHRRVNAINAELTNLIMESDAAKRLNPESAKLEVKPFFVKTSDDSKTVRSKLNGIYNLIRQHAAPTPYMNRYAPQSVPQYSGGNTNSLEGKTASDGKGNRVIMENGRWVPYGG